MRAKVNFGCLQGTQSLNAGLHPMSNVRQWMEEYRCERLSFELPNRGSTQEQLVCPVCSQGVTLRLSSAGEVTGQLRMALVIIGAVVLGLAALLYLGPGLEFPIIWKIAVGVGILFLVGATLADQFPVSWLKEYLISIVNDEVRNRPQEPGYGGMRGHKLLEINLS